MIGPSSFLLLVTAVVAAAAYAWGRRVLRLEAAGLRRAFAFGLECVGLWAVFSAAHLAVGIGVALASRAVDGPFVSTYWASDAALLLLALFEALVFQGWRQGRDSGRAQP